MNAEQIKAAREALDSMDDYARMNTGIDAIGPRKVLEDFIAEAERATQPAQDLSTAQQENADFHQWWESSGQKADHDLRTENAAHAAWQERASRNEDGENDYLIDRLGKLLAGVAVALNGPEPALTRWSYHDLPEKATKLMLELEIYRATAPAQDQVAAVRAVLSGERQEECPTCNGTGVVDDGEIDHYPNGEPYMCGPVKCVKDCPDCAAPSPQPELSGSIDSEEFRNLLIASRLYGDDPAHYTEGKDALVAYIDAKLAQAREDGMKEAQGALSANDDFYNRWIDEQRRADRAEAALSQYRHAIPREPDAEMMRLGMLQKEVGGGIIEIWRSMWGAAQSHPQRTSTPSQSDTSCIKDCRTGTQTVRELAATMIEMKQKESELTWVSKGHRINLYVKILRNMPQESDTSGLPG